MSPTEFLEESCDETEHWQKRAVDAMQKLDLYWRVGNDEMQYWRARALALEALVVQKVDGADFYP